MNPVSHSIAENLHNILGRIAQSAHYAHRPVNDIQLVAVSKNHGIEQIEPTLLSGQRLFGENRVQEALTKWPELKNRYSGISLHLIGPLQTNKIAQALSIFDVIETVDRPKLAELLAKEKAKRTSFPECYIQVNIGEEPQKAGIMPSEADGFITYCKHELALPITGLMCIPPADRAPDTYFSQLAALARKHGLPNISMGMSGDFEAAIAHGATHVRVGTAIFGSRGYNIN